MLEDMRASLHSNEERWSTSDVVKLKVTLLCYDHEYYYADVHNNRLPK